MVQPDPQAPRLDHGPGLYRVGCLGRLSSFSETDDGKLLITLTGLIRFTIDSELDMVRGYRRVRGDFSRFTDDLDVAAPARRSGAGEAAGRVARLFRAARRRRQLGCDPADVG